MKKLTQKKSWIIAILTMVGSFFLLLFGIGLILNKNINFTNIVAYFIISILIALIAYGFSRLNPLVGFFIFEAGIAFGFLYMYLSFMKNMDGWGDLASFLSFLIICIITFLAALIGQLIAHIIKKNQ